MIIQILNTIDDDIKQIRTDVFMKEQGFENVWQYANYIEVKT